MSLTDPTVFMAENSDGSAEMTLTVADDDHKFSVSHDGETAYVDYEETLSWRGKIQTREPDERIWRMLMQSENMTDYLESNGLTGVRRKRQ